MSRFSRTLLVCGAAGFIVGCTPPIFHRAHIDDGYGYSLDAKQRLVLVTAEGGPHKNRRIVCAEPSPDALTAQAAALSAQGGTPSLGIGVSGGSSEAAAAIGLRTQTITLLRDGYYRLCEGYLNGVVSKEQYNLALAGIDDLMVKLLAIDAIAGAPRTAQVTISPAVPGTSASQNLSQTVSGAAEAAGSNESTSQGSTAVTGTARFQMIGDIPDAKGINAEEAKVLMEVVKDNQDQRMVTFCLSLLSDPSMIWREGEGSLPLEPRPVNDIKAFCGQLLRGVLAKLAPKPKSITELEKKFASLEEKVEKSKGDKEKINALETSLNAARAEGSETLAEQARSLAVKAIEKPIIVK